MNWSEISEAVVAGTLSGVIVSVVTAFGTYYLHFFLAKAKMRRAHIRQLIDELEEHACRWLALLHTGSAADQHAPINRHGLEYRLFHIALRRLSSVLTPAQRADLVMHCTDLAAQNVATPQQAAGELEQLLENLKRVYQEHG